LQVPQGSGDLIFRYLIPHTVSGLDSATESTLQAFVGMRFCWMAPAITSCVIRAASRIEVVNLNANVPDPWQAIAKSYQAAFKFGFATCHPAAGCPCAREALAPAHLE